MNYIEYIYICLAAPLYVAIMLLRRESRRAILFILGGMTACLLSSYISTYLAVLTGADQVMASAEISPVVEEVMKLFPVIFYLLVYEPRREVAASLLPMIAIGFATFENVCYLSLNGAGNLLRLMIRGFGTGAMHIVCSVIFTIGLMHLWDRVYLRVAGTVGLLSLAITYHAIYNVLVLQEGLPARIGYLIPIGTMAAIIVNTRFKSTR